MPDSTIDQAFWPTTQWVLLGDLSPQAQQIARERALDKLCAAYDRPILAYLESLGFPGPDAEDARQGFFKDVVIGRDLLGRARQPRGRLRDLIRRSVRNYANNIRRKNKAGKREGAWQREGCDDIQAGDIAAGAPVARVETPAEVFTREWGRNLIERAHLRLDEEYARKGETRLCETLKPHLERWISPPSQEAVARTLSISTSSISTELNRLRERYRRVLLRLLSDEGGTPQDSERELHALLRAFAS